MKIFRKERYFLVYEISFLSLMSALVYVLKTFLKTPIGLPGHTAIFWVIPFIIGIGVTRKFGSGAFIGVLSGLLIGFLGTSDTGPFKVFEYIAMGITMDVLATFFKGHLGNVLVGVILGSFGSFDKMLVNYYVTSAIGQNANILLLGIGTAGISHLLFGGVGGAISAAIVNRVQNLHFPNREAKKSERTENSRRQVRRLHHASLRL